MNDQWTDRLSDYIDGELPAGERMALEAHLATCGDCRATLEELRAVVARARALEDEPPARDLWAGIRGGIAPARGAGARHPWRVSLGVPQLLAASIALVLVTGTGTWLALRGRAPEQTASVTPSPAAPLITNVATPAGWAANTALAVAQLEDALARNESRLDTATVRVMRQNLALIDRAIERAQRALAADPGSAYLNLHLAQTMRRKIELLRRANALATAES